MLQITRGGKILMMRTILLLTVFLLKNSLFAQDSSKYIIFFSPYFTNDKTNNSYDLTNYNSTSSTPGNYTIEEKMSSSYYDISLNVKTYKKLSEKYVEIFQLGFGKDKYNSSIPYKTYKSNDIWDYGEKTETIDGLKINFQYGIGKKIAVDKTKKLNFVLEGLMFSGITSFNKTISNYIKGQSFGYALEYNGSDLSFGIKCNLVVNYQMNKHFGIGLTLNDLFNAYGLKTYRNETFYIDENEFLFNIGQLSRPTLSLLYFL